MPLTTFGPELFDMVGRRGIRQVTAAVSIGVLDARCDIVSGAGAFIITLPSVTEAAGLFFGFEFITDGGGNVTIAHAGDSEQWTNVVLTAANDHLQIYSNGYRWVNVEEVST